MLELLRDQPEPCTVAALAALSHQHPNTVREHLDGLVACGLAERTRAAASGRGRPAWLYASTEEVTLSPGARQYADLAVVLAEQLAEDAEPAGRARAAGRRWGARLAARPSAPSGPRPRTGPHQPVVQLLADLGFAPEVDPEPAADETTAERSVVHLRRCPLLEAAYQHPEIVCGVHTGLVEGALQATGEQDTDVDLQPFAEPGACRLTLERVAGEATGTCGCAGHAQAAD